MSRTASSAIARVSAATAATRSPTKRTRSQHSTGQSWSRRPRRAPFTSAPVITARTPGSARAGGARVVVTALDDDGAPQRQLHRTDAHLEGPPNEVAIGGDVARTRYAACRRGQIHQDRPNARARRIDRDGVLQLHATSRSARPLQTPAIPRLYPARPRRSALGSVAAAPSEAAAAHD